ncbi:DNA gyrase inhibitor YacG [Massilia sp. H-1]|nr:DNA gyrase inhibitor YacG [Massilia sp. H-1]
MPAVKLPYLPEKVEWTEANKFRPFCSERCKQIDLGAWAEEKYTIPGAPAADDLLPDQDNG